MQAMVIVQARMGSTRLPGKSLTRLCGKPMLWHILKRVENAVSVNKIVIATSREAEDDEIEHLALENNFLLWRGSQNHVLERFYECASYYKPDIVIRLTGDNALVDAGIIDQAVSCFQEKEWDYLYYREGLPIGLAVEVFTYDALKYAYDHTEDEQCKEHVTPFFYKNPQIFRIMRMPCVGEDYSNLRWTMDTEQDRKLIASIYENLYPAKGYFSYTDILDAYRCHPEWIEVNQEISQKKVTYEGEA